ncbi:rhodanese-like domain-containing protein [Candidatus Woesearchaeota archaeon]|nr:rhodanese-like domain-containing protein [Candidatus Woesearchaeota archaeon]
MIPTELKQKQDNREEFVILDVREPNELKISQLEGNINIPLGELQEKYLELDKEKDIIVVCRTGWRSANAVSFLKEKGFKKVENLDGGINLWADTVDHSIEKY